MRLSLRGRLLLGSVAILVVVGVPSGLALERLVRQSVESRIERELFRLAQTSRAALLAAPGSEAIESIDALADQLGSASRARVTIVARDGIVLGDSLLSPIEVEAADNLGTRPEILDALADGSAVARRYSTAEQAEVLYVAIPFEKGALGGVVRVSQPLEEVDPAIVHLRLALVLAGLLALGIAVGVSGLWSQSVTRALAQLVDRARGLSGAEDSRIVVSSGDELGRLAGSINRLAEELNTALAQLARERDRFETVIEGMSDAVLAVDEESRITLINSAARDLLDTEGDPLGQRLLEVSRLPALSRVVESGRQTPTEDEFDLAGGRRVMARATPLQKGQGVVLVVYDVTEVRRLEQVRKDFIANASHELRTPISVIRANAETVLQGQLPDPMRRFAEALHRNAERLAQIVSDLLDLSRLEEGRYDLQLEPVEVRAAVEGAVASVARRAETKHIEVVDEVPEGLSCSADSHGLDHVLFNLLDNAVKYTPEGGRVRIEAAPSGGDVRIRVIDSGPGIDPRHRSRIFERFYRVDPGRSRDMGGTGLGLSIVKHLVEAMDGAVGVEGAEPQGAVFWVSLPGAARAR